MLGMLLYLGSSVAVSVHVHRDGAAVPATGTAHAVHSGTTADSAVAEGVADSDALTVRSGPGAPDEQSARDECRLCELAQRTSRASLAPPIFHTFTIPANDPPAPCYVGPPPTESPALDRQAPRAPPRLQA